MEYCLIEDLNSNIPLPNNCQLVALTVDASSKLDNLGIEYSIIDDYLNMKDTYGDVDTYLSSQLKWFKSFDKMVKELYGDAKTLNIDLPELYFYNIKYLVDQIILTSRMLNGFFEKARPNKVWFYSQVFGEDYFDRWSWFYFGDSSFSRIVDLICEKKQIKLEKKIINATYTKSDNPFHDGTILSKVKQLIPRSIKNSIKSSKNNLEIALRPSSNKNKKTIFIIKSNGYVQEFCRDAVENGYKIKYFNKKMLDDSSFPIIENANVGADYLKNSNLMKWINDKCEFDTYDIIKDRFHYLLNSLFPETLSMIISFMSIYEKEKVDFVLNYSLGTEIDFAAAMAAKINKSTKSVGFYHGMDAFKAPFRYFMEIKHFDIYFSSTSGEVEHFSELSKQFDNHSKSIISEYPYLRNKMVKLRNRYTHPLDNSKKPIVLYLPIMRKIRSNMPIDLSIPLNMSMLKWHMALIDYFSSKIDNHFIWKAYLHSPFNYDPIENYIKKKKFKNLTFSNIKLQNWLPKVDRVICDVPSTAFFEASLSGKSVITFFDKDIQQFRESVFDTFGSSIKSFKNIDEGIKIIDEFLHDESGKYVVDIEKLIDSNASVFDVLEKI